MTLHETDVAVIGAGSAGLAAYRAVNERGRRALLIEPGPFGTTCARSGCMPSKLLIAPADAAHAVSRLPAFGLAAGGPVEVDGRSVMARVRRERDRFVGFITAGIDALPAGDVLRGRARFVDDRTLRVGDDVTVRAASVVIATGSSPAHPAAWDVLGDRLVTNSEVFEWIDLPRRVAVLGPGVMGLELGQALHRLGVHVVVYGRGPHVGPLRDPAVLAEATRLFGAELPLELGAHVTMARDGDEVVVTSVAADGAARVARFDYVLAATGRRPNVGNLGLESTTLELDGRGVPRYDRTTLRCGTSPIFIAGDADDDTALLHEAADEGQIAGDNAATYPDVRAGLRRAPLVIVFTDPQMAIVGGGFDAVRAVPHVTGEVSFERQGRARIMLRNAGLARVYADSHSGRFLGAEVLGPDAEHLGHLLAWSLQMALTVVQMLEMPYYHPVVEEGLRTALRDAQKRVGAVPLPCPGGDGCTEVLMS